MIPTVVCDSRENRSQVLRELEKLGCNIVIEGNMPVADYVCSDRVAMERKTAEDFWHDFIENKEFFPKLLDLKKAYEIPILIFECDPIEIYTIRNIPGDTVDAILNTIARLGIAVRYTYNAQGTAKLLKWFALKEQTGGQTRLIQMHGSRREMNPQQKLEYAVSAIDGVGRGTAVNLLKHFHSFKAIVNADIEQLKEVDLVGKATAIKLKDFFEREY